MMDLGMLDRISETEYAREVEAHTIGNMADDIELMASGLRDSLEILMEMPGPYMFTEGRRQEFAQMLKEAIAKLDTITVALELAIS